MDQTFHHHRNVLKVSTIITISKNNFYLEHDLFVLLKLEMFIKYIKVSIC